MRDIPRLLRAKLTQELSTPGKVIVLYGPRQAGKTTLAGKVIAELPHRALTINADEERFHAALSSKDSRQHGELVEGYELLFIDEAQRVPEIGLNLKIIVDTFPDLRIMVTGSSALELATGVSEPLTGRKWTYRLFPIAQAELRAEQSVFELREGLDERLRWGSYPEIFKLDTAERKTKYLYELASDYLYKDILKLVDIRNPDKLRTLLRLLAFQVGSEASLSELGSAVGMSKETVERYIDLLEKSFVLFRLSGFSRNLRKEITKSNKYYFYDLGIRNALIDNFKAPSDRQDVGALWENFLISERIKRNTYTEKGGSHYFWRTYTGAEIDYIEDCQGELSGYEFKSGRRKARRPETFLNTYPGSSWEVVNRENWIDFVTVVMAC